MNALSETKFIMKKYNITANKRFGQNFLIDDDVISSIIENAEVSKDDLIIEIGPGLGTLTAELIQKAGKVSTKEEIQFLIKKLIELNLSNCPHGRPIYINITKNEIYKKFLRS